jgi:hypothetical protein
MKDNDFIPAICYGGIGFVISGSGICQEADFHCSHGETRPLSDIKTGDALWLRKAMHAAVVPKTLGGH